MDDELEAEKRPRTQQQWLERARKKTRLPALESGHITAGPRQGPQGGEGAPPGKKKQKRLKMLATKKGKKVQQQMAEAQKSINKVTEAVKGKVSVKSIDISPAAVKILQQCPKVAEAQQRLLAKIAERVSADPQQDVPLADAFFELHRRGCDLRTRQLALLSAVAVFKDLVPGYRVRELSEQERSSQLSKEVLELTKHEMQLLMFYKRLLPLIETAMKHQPRVYVGALAALVKSAFDFNYRQRLLGTAVHHACHPLAAVRRVLAQGLQEMFEADMRLAASREVVLAVGRLAQAAAMAAGKKPGGKKGGKAAGKGGKGGKAGKGSEENEAGEAGQAGEAGKSGGAGENGVKTKKTCPLATELLKALFYIPVGRAEAAELRGVTGNLDGADDELRKGFAEASTSYNVQQLRKAEAELLYEVFVVYLRILRQRHLHSRDLVAAVLSGLARWGQHVNLELLIEILTELRHTVLEAIGQSDELVSLQGLNCALVLLAGPSQALIADATWLADAMTATLALTLPSLYSVHSESAAWPPAGSFSVSERRLVVSEAKLSLALETESIPSLLLRCLEAALSCPQGYGKASDAALATLIEHLFLLAATADIHVGLPLLREASVILRKHHRLHTLLEIEGGLFGLGQVADRAVSVVWPLQPLAFSACPDVVSVTTELRGAIVSRRTLLADIFPFKDSNSWMEAEFPHHIGALGEFPETQTTKGGRQSGTAVFMSEADLSKVWGKGSY